jgi:hypothetical protein
VYACQVISKDSSILALGSLGAGIVSSSFSSSLITNQLAAVSTAQLSLLTQTFSTLSSGVQTRSNRIDGRSVRKNEKLLYVFFFKTSQHNTLVQKMQTHTATTTGVETFGSITWLEPKYTGGEKYDLFDVNGTSYMFGSSQVKIKPLVHFADPRSGYWNTAYTQPAIYDLYSAFRNGSYTTLKLLRPTPDTIGVPPRWTIKFDTDYIPTNGLAPSEFLPLSTAPNSVFSNLTNTMKRVCAHISTISEWSPFPIVS